jgi:hypothetical protein
MLIFLQEVISSIAAIFQVLCFEKLSTLAQILPIKLAPSENLHSISVIYLSMDVPLTMKQFVLQIAGQQP